MRTWFQAGVLLAAAFAAAPVWAQAPAQGKLLVASPEIGDVSWAETVVLLLHHDESGTLGVAINRPTWVEPQAVQPALGELESYAGHVYRGGPAAPTRMVFLVRDPPPGLIDAAPIVDGIHAGGDLRVFGRLARELDGGDDQLRIYAGHAEWAPGQLANEIAAGQWTVVDGNADRVFAADPDRLWQVLSADGDELLVRGRDARLTPLLRPARRAASTYPR